MAKNLFITALEAKSGISLSALGIMELLVRNLERVAFFRPIINSQRFHNGKDEIIHLIQAHYNLALDHEQMYAFTLDEAKALVTEKKHDKLLEGILDKYKKLENDHDFVLCLGTDFESDSPAFEFELNVDIANNLSSPVLMIANAHEEQDTTDRVVKSCQFAMESFEEKGIRILSVIVNRCPASRQEELQRSLREKMAGKVDLIYTIPYEESLNRLTMAEIAQALNAKVVYGNSQLNRPVSRFVIAAMNLRSFLNRVGNDNLVITPIDRLDIILGILAAYRSRNMARIGGIVLTGYFKPDKLLRNLLEGMHDLVPILKVEEDTFTTATRIKEIHTCIRPEAIRKIAAALGLFESNVNSTELRSKIVGYSMISTSPKMFEFGLIKRARQFKQTIVLPEGEEDRILFAAEILLHRDAVNIILLGRKTVIDEKITSLGLELGGVKIIEPTGSNLFDDYADTYYALRKHKGITPDNARDVMSAVNYFGTMMVYKGHADGMVSGAVHSTLNTVRPSLEFVKTKPGSTIMSSIFLMCLEDRVLAYGDCAVNPRPTAEQLAEIAVESSLNAELFGIKPMVAMLSYSSGTSGIGEEVEKVKKATAIARRQAPDLPIEGPIQYDAAVDMTVARTKMPHSKVAGRATVFIFPDLNTGNNTYKAVQRSAKAMAIGPIMQGLNKPVNDLSRGCTVADIVNTVAITAIQAQHQKGLI
ncbi:phosphate acetyltransferase [Desulforhopalus singaporensis]|uniref:Phosphate acetyltransferase n=1 Tax=Desulforhopalus singaporensis TaxID=91360 RepID=A0A1H0LDC6_9BACT|nr:phosphate acetyltransferase [Desulforhopalus singaporensis]SDO66046.1 phosphotransacetylase [Desulforhopalus singaporensis]